MVTKTVKAVNEQGVHMRPAGLIAKAVKQYPECEVTLSACGKQVKAKAPMQIMSACIKKNCDVEIICDGNGEAEALAKIAELFESGFGE